MDIATIIGLILSFTLMVFGMANGEAGIAALSYFVHGPSALITFGGTLGCVLASYHLQDFL